MAMDFSGYAQAYGGAPDLSGLQRGLSDVAAAIPTNEEKASREFSRYWSDRDRTMSPTFKMGEAGALSYQGTPTSEGTFSADSFKVSSLTEEWNNYREHLNSKGIRMRPDEYTQFAEAHQLKSQQWGQDIASKFERMKLSGISQSKIRALISSNPALLQNLVKMSAISPVAYASIADYLTPGKGVVPGIWDKKGELGLAASPLGVMGAYGAGKAYMAGESVAGGFKRGVTPGAGLMEAGGRFGMGEKGSKQILEEARKTQYKPGKGGRGAHERGGYDPGKKELQKIQKDAQKGLKGTKETLKNKQDALDKAKKKYDKKWHADKKKGKIKGKNPAFHSTKDGQKLSKARKAAQEAVQKAKQGVKTSFSSKTRTKTGMKVISSFIKKHGVGGLIKEIARKGGPKTAAKIAAKLAVGGVLKGSGIGTIAGLAMDAFTIAHILKILGKTVKEESGGFRAPGEMMFGGDDPSRAHGATF